ncbi:predicted protein [Sclerotinia sclerotiorum 1980 UF-70]|uniref:Uncharacterized protein n=1 Tax=Sclerotinia sclerotiorum (strain ATCC 18683 / 1980 / Ss-1) TaxID=665079 RepID=A7E4Y4_SCLS1|nr:predicted protein [Sclerotinia sclerotiorum 1980 UF-70]EDN90956.1 predicted protein [Sclerotinia sclerotiorum 1980 UF-70]
MAVSGDAPASTGDTCSNLQSRIVMGHWENETKAGKRRRIREIKSNTTSVTS